MAMPALTRAQSEATTPAERAACERMSDAAERRGLTVFGPSSFVVPEADPNTPAFCVSSQRRNGAWHLVWLQTVDGPLGPVQRLMCSCPARLSPRVFTCSHAQAVRLHLAAQCAASSSWLRSSVKSSGSGSAGAPSSGGASGAAGGPPAGLGSAEVLRRAEFDRRLDAWLEEQRRDTPITWTVETNDPTVPADAVESLNAWHAALDAQVPDPTPADLGEPDPDDETDDDDDDDDAHDAIWELQHGPDPDPDPDDDDDDPDPTPPPAAPAAALVACPSCGQLANPDDVREIGTCLDCVLAAEVEEVESAEEQPDAPEEPEPPIVVHCPRCGRDADPDAVAAHGACARCIQARPELSQSAKRTPEQKAEARRRIVEAEQQRQRHYRRNGRDDDPRQEEQRRERAAKAEARRRERRESDDNPRADHETAPLYRDNRPISPFRETRAPYTATQPQPDDPRYLGTNDLGQRFYAVGEHQTIFTIHHELHPDHPCRRFFYCTWACWLTRGHEMAGVTIDHDTGAITGVAPQPQPQPDPRALQARLMRLGGAFERARLDHDHTRAIAAGDEIARTGAQMPEIYAWWLTVIRGRNAIRRARGLEPVHY